MSGSDSPTFFHGQPWSSWIERIGRDKPLSDEETESQPSSFVTRLSAEDIDLYGFCPERDTFYGVVCELCNAIVKPQALIQHMESRHPSGTANFPPPPMPIVKAPVKTPYCKVSKLKKTQSSPQIPIGTKLNHTSIKRTADQANLSTSLPISSSPRSPLESLPVQPSNSGGGLVAGGGGSGSGGGAVGGGGGGGGVGGGGGGTSCGGVVTKLEEDFANEELRSLESSLAAATASAGSVATVTNSQPAPMMAPISVVLPSLSPLPANSEESPVSTLIPTTVSPAMPMVAASLPAACAQTSVVGTVLDGESVPVVDMDTETMTMYSPVYGKDGKSQLVVQISRPNNISQSPVSRSVYHQQQVMQASMPSLSIFEPMEQLEQQHPSQINGKRLNHATHTSTVARQAKRSKHDYQQDFPTAIQVEATTTSTPYPHFGDISWSNCHPEPLAVSRWLRITSSRKQYNFNIH